MTDVLAKEYSDMIFTLIYPIKMDGLWCYLRVSEGIIDLDDFEPVFYRTCDEDNETLPELNEHSKLRAIRAKPKVEGKGKGKGINAKDALKTAGDVARLAKSGYDLYNALK